MGKTSTAKINIYFITIVITLGGLLFGYDTGVINGTQFYFSKYFELTGALKGFIVSSALLGALAGAASAGLISKAIGRKNSLIISAVLFLISAWGSGLPSILPESTTLLVIFRLIGGIAIGMASMNAPMYIAEIAPAKNRGILVTFYQLAVVIGFFVVFLVTYFIGSELSESENIAFGWRNMFWSELVPAGFFFVLLFFVPKSPRWLMIKGKEEEAENILTRIHGEEIAVKEIKAIKDSIKAESTKVKASIFNKTMLPIVIIGTVLSALQQFTGINAVLYYGADIFEQALGFGQDDVLLQQILLASVNLIFTFVAMFTVDKLGRKPLLIIGGFGMLIGFLLMGFTLYFSDYAGVNSAGLPTISSSEGIVSLIGVLIFIGSFAMSMGPIVWVLLSEMFPNKIRSTAMAVAVAVQWLANYFVSQTFPIVVESESNGLIMNGGTWNNALPYFLFSFFIIIIIVFVYKYIPETKGKTLEEMEALFAKK
ncbi:sugar porter family MFS transporter [Maribacter polysiphoniae]|uniref:SP family xylose:H+ symportor-like MFS transporter n=1 Tax=Maribacter polysiphoniae TaxID=429344 RepID=A0A316E5M0_9FLAO|nr:sugar porter family MFS transporter [Maribacter polysiphoniae]MBD1262298.1 sugar porter family MFS transporter [Maribacter polysiphoniae]PWK25997.1 SP family xylose:H+ symportor-like MFS transporter [Maribacter polysiphoniae]